MTWTGPKISSCTRRWLGVTSRISGGAYVTPTLIRDVSPGHRLVQEEIFGPVQVIMPFDGEQQAICLLYTSDAADE